MTKTPTPASHAVNTAPISADLRGMEDVGAQPAPITYMTEDHACKWAWDQVQQDVGTKGWTAGDSCNFYGFFLWGWNYRGQYETQRPAAPTAPAGGAVPDERQAFEHYQCDRMRRDLQELTMHPDGRYDCDDIQAEWEVWQARAALAAAPAQAVAVPLAWKPLPENADERRIFSDATSVYGGDVRVQLASMLSSFASAYPRGSFGAQLAIMANEVAKLHLAPAQEHATQLAGQGQALQEVFTRADRLIDVMDDYDQNAPEHRSYVSGAYEDSLNDLRRAVTAARAVPAQAQEDARDAVKHMLYYGASLSVGSVGHPQAIPPQSADAIHFNQEGYRAAGRAAGEAIRAMPLEEHVPTDTERLDWLIKTEFPHSADGFTLHDDVRVWNVHFPTAREAIDYAIAARAAQGGA